MIIIIAILVLFLVLIVAINVEKVLKPRIIHYKCDICGDDIRYPGTCQDCLDLIDQDTCDNNQGD
jgi:hypothetical protein